MALTPLIDVIFLLLLFFMLSSTFSRFGEIDLASAGQGAAAPDTRQLFLRVSPQTVTLNGRAIALETLGDAIRALPEKGRQTLLLAPMGDITAQRLTDVLVAANAVSGLNVVVLGGT